MDSLECRCLLSGTIYVDSTATGTGDGSTWANAYTNLQTALGVAVSGDTIDVAQGTYTPTQTNDPTATYQLIDGVTIEGGFAGQANPNAAQNPTAYSTVLSGNIPGGTSYHVVTGSGTDSSAILDGFTITGGDASGTGTDLDGGGMFNDNGSPTISDCTFNADSSQGSPIILISNLATIGGGAIYDFDSSPNITNCTFSNNFAIYGSGIYNSGSSPTITNCTFTGNGNQFDGFVQGSGVFNFNSSPSLNNCTFSANQAGNGAAIGIGGDSSPVMTNCEILDNSSQLVGGAVFDNGTGDAEFVDCEFEGNSSKHDQGGAIAIFESDLTLINCTFTQNSGIVSGTFPGGAAILNQGTATITNCVLWGDIGGSEVSNSVSGNGTPTGTSVITFSDVQGGYTGASNIDGDPRFVSAASDNYSLQADSACINAGSNAAVPTGLTTDLAGNPRIFGGTVDMGAYEFQGPYAPLATQLGFTQLPVKPVVNSAISPIVVSLENQNGKVVASDDAEVTLSIRSGPSGATLTGTLTATASNGVATFGSLTLSAVGTYTLLATDYADNLTMVSAPFVVSSGAPAKLVFAKQPPDTVVAGSAATIVVDIEDQYGNIATSANGNVTLSPLIGGLLYSSMNVFLGGSSFGPKITLRAVDGVAKFRNLPMTKAGWPLNLQASHGSLADIYSSTFTVTPAAASKLVLAVGSSPSYSANITVEDAFGNTITSASGKATISIASGPPGATLPDGKSTQVVQLSSGQGSLAFSFPATARFTLQATHAALPEVQSSFLYNNPGSGSLVFPLGDQPTTARTGMRLTSPVVVKIKDMYGDLENTSNGKVTLSIYSGPDGTILGGTTTVNAVDGIATFDDILFLAPATTPSKQPTATYQHPSPE